MDRGVMCLSPETMTKPRMPFSFDCLWQRPNRKVHILLLLHTYMRLLSASTKNIFEHMQVTLETAWLFCLCVIQAIYLPLQLQYSFHTFGTNHTRCSCILEKCIFLLEGPAWVQHQITVPSAAQLWESCCVISCVLERANSQQPLSLLLLDQRKSLLTLRGLYKRKDLAGMWLKRLPVFYHICRKLCAESRAPFQIHQKSLTSVLFSPGPSGAEAPQGGLSVDHILRDYMVRGQPKSGNTKTHGWGTTAHSPCRHNPFVLFWMWVFQFLKGQVLLLLFAYYKISLPWKQGKPNSSLFW